MLLMNFNSQNKTENKNPHPVSLLHVWGTERSGLTLNIENTTESLYS
ncbi:Uncharacterised protein [Parabacteroides distasonis]|uniref:Uncharacterized protein n=1 Tax=Parabacteroides distasonis TaxID=823 RepID=A0A174P0A8_PARDI|nr:Uncharacterised protein [Parabacteroides distasonis]